MCITNDSPVGWSSVPAMTQRRSPLAGAQNRFEPHSPQKPRRAPGEDSYQRRPRSSISRSRSCETAVAAAKLPEVRRHWLQWQATTGRSLPRSS